VTRPSILRALIFLVGVGLCLGAGGTAHAHAVLLQTLPGDRGVVAEAPDAIVLRFNEVVQPIVVELRDNSANLIPADVTQIDQETHLVPRTPLGPGGYIVSYRVASADSHPVAGAFVFAVGRAPAEWASPLAASDTYDGWTWSSAIDRALFLAAGFVAVGGWLFVFVVRRTEPLYPLIPRAAAFGIGAAILGIYLQGGVLLDATDATPWDIELWRVGFFSTRGTALCLAIVGLALCIARRYRLLALLGCVTVIVSFTLSGHAATASPHWIAIPTLLLHVTIVAFWLGSLMPLLAALRRMPAETRMVFARFTDAALVLVPQLLLAGIILAVLQVQRADAFFASSYGLILSVKLALVGLLLVLAACNRWVLMPEMDSDVPGHAMRLRRAIQGELVLGFLILCVTAFLSQTVPPRALIEQQAAAVEAARETGQTALIVVGNRKALLLIDPARAGRNTIRVRVLNDDDQPIDPLEVSVDLSNPAAGIEPLHRALTPAEDSYFDYTGPELSIAGTWTIRIDALISDFEKSVFETEIIVK
jgi:copper transport protein